LKRSPIELNWISDRFLWPLDRFNPSDAHREEENAKLKAQ
jgi:hypothetical protein